ncbi:hypothetical protein N1F78_15330 [Seonamhaeicola sp. MEBiC1930]|uniref:hypothetical protein n=1 Tax=Seonamhaeicola sp. MEBiC01930 TaxID=2976768 RepID=UPI003248AEA3
MKNTLILFVVFFITIGTLQAQKKSNKDEKQNVFAIDTTKANTIDSTIKTLYATISGEKGEKRNWGQFKFLFYKDAKLIPSGENKKGEFKLAYMTPSDYVKSSGKWLENNGFFEKEIHRETQQFGNLVHVFSTYEAYYNSTDEKPFMRGINSIQLLYDNNRWWIVNIYWTNETEKNKIPKKYLP